MGTGCPLINVDLHSLAAAPEKRTLPADLIRLSIGIEDARDIVDDLAHAFKFASSDSNDELGGSPVVSEKTWS